MKRYSLFEGFSEATDIEPKQIIGTKWNSWCKDYQGRVSVEFVDNKNCVYKSQPREFPVTYVIKGGKLFISFIEGAFELRGNVLFNNNLPAFEKVA